MHILRGQQSDFSFEDASAPATGSIAALTRWAPDNWPVADDWRPVVSAFLASGEAARLGRFMEGRLAAGAIVYPPQPFRALALTPLANVRVVILGQDPYHGPGQAHGLAFSVAHGVAIPPSLRNIFKEIARGTSGAGVVPGAQARLFDGSLERWAQQGVLLLNTCLTVESGQAASHAKQGWEVLTDELIKAAWSLPHPVVFMLWGAHAQAKRALFEAMSVTSDAKSSGARHLVLTANHPSPLSALRPPQPFIGCGHFVRANAFLVENGQQPVDW